MAAYMTPDSSDNRETTRAKVDSIVSEQRAMSESVDTQHKVKRALFDKEKQHGGDIFSEQGHG